MSLKTTPDQLAEMQRRLKERQDGLDALNATPDGELTFRFRAEQMQGLMYA